MANLFVCGDIVNMSDSNEFIGGKLAEIISTADYSIANLEGPELNDSIKCSGPHQMEGTVRYLQEVGFNMMLLANNHITEYGAEGIKNTLQIIEKNGMDHIGAGLSWKQTYRPFIKKIEGIKFGFINVSEAQTGQYITPSQSFGYAWMGYNGLFADVEKLSKVVDYVIVFVHAGLEHFNIPLPEIKDFYHRLCDAGAFSVIGGHPHIAQGYEYYGDKLIVYSLGNFYFPHSPGVYENENNSYSVLLSFGENSRVILKAIHHTLNNGVVNVENNVSNQVDITSLCRLISNDYEKRADEMCVKAYYEICEKLLAESVCGETTDITKAELLKSLIKRTISRNRTVNSTRDYRQKLLLRLFENETYRYTIIRALKSISK